MTDAELLLACLERSGLTRKAFCQEVLAGRAVITLRRWLSGQAIPKDARRFLERYHSRLLRSSRAKRYNSGQFKARDHVA